tara:strand:+ start:933 stop:1118 length:186 start_codon:yes stop_codon:yes gene_type:complete
MKKIILISFIYLNCISVQPDTSTVKTEIPLFRTDYPDTIVVSRELADRLIKESGGMWQKKK